MLNHKRTWEHNLNSPILAKRDLEYNILKDFWLDKKTFRRIKRNYLENLRKVIKNQKFDNEFSHKLLNFEYHFKNIFEVCSFSFEKIAGHIYSMVLVMNIRSKLMKNKTLYEKSKNKKIFLR